MAEPVLRRRHQAADAAGLDEPLLGFDDESEAHRTAAGRGSSRQDSHGGSGSRALVPYSINAYDWADLIRGIVSNAVTGLRGLATTLSGCVAWLRQPRVQLSVLAAARLAALRQRIAVPFVGADPKHQEMLRQLWAAAYPGEPCDSLKTERWKDMGWQGTDPGTDFRGAGLLALECLLFLAQRQPARFDALRHKREGMRSQWEYPFAVGGVNLTFMLLEALDLRDDSRLPKTHAGRHFLLLLDEQPKSRPPTADGAAAASAAPMPFEQLFCGIFSVLDRQWLARKATYMEFPAVMKATRKEVERALAGGRGSMADTLRLLEAS